MSYVTSVLNDCPDLQAELDQYFNVCDASLLPDPAPLNEFLWSGLNRSGIQQLISPGNGKVRTVQLRYDQRLLESAVTTVDGCTTNCSATTRRGDLITEYTIDTCNTLQVEELIKSNDMKAACRSNPQIVLKKIAMLMKAMEAKVATSMTALAIAKYGAWQANVQNTVTDATGNAKKALKLQTKRPTAFTDVNPEAFYDLQLALKQSNYCNGAAVFAGYDLAKYAGLMQAGCCSNQGIDLGEILNQYGVAVMWDRRFENAMGHEYGMALMPGALQPIYFNQAIQSPAQAAGVTTGTNYEEMIMFTMNGIPVDVILSDNCGNFSIIVRATVDLKALPTDMFAPGDNMEGVTFVNKLKVINA
ncbi:MAG: hypothetical protein ACEQSL_07695 [Sediminibacterium sp.]